MTKVWQFLKNDTGRNGTYLRGENENLSSSADVLYKTSNLAFHVVALLTTAKKWTKVKNARAGRAKLLFLPTKYTNL